MTTDLGGNPRFADSPLKADTGSGTAPIVDMGAYERSPAIATIGGTTGDDFLCLRVSADQLTLDVFNGLVPAGQPVPTFAIQSYDAFVILDSGAGNDTVAVTGFAATDALSIQPGQMLLNSIIFFTSNIETLLIDVPGGSALSLASLTVSRPVALVAGRSIALRLGALSITAAGVLDLAENGMILNYTGSAPMQAVNGWLANGRMGVTPWLKTSGAVAAGTAALGMVDNALIHLNSFAGQTLGGVFSQLLIQQTVAGDANLDGVVDPADFLAVIANMGRTGTQCFLGDLNCDGVVSADDFAEVASHLGNRLFAVSGDSASDSSGGTLVEEKQKVQEHLVKRDVTGA